MNNKTNKFHKKIVRLFTYNIHIKLLCLLLSFLLFLYVRYQKEYSKDFISKVQVRNKPSNLVIINDIKDTININIKGFRDNIYDIPRSFDSYIDLANAKVGSNNYRVEFDDDIGIYDNLYITVNPNIIAVVLDELYTKEVPIVLKTSSTNNVSNMTISPSVVKISGAKSIVDSIVSINTEFLDLETHHLDYTTNLKLELYDNIEANINSINVDIVFKKDLKVVEFNDLDLHINNLNSQYSITSPSNLKIDKLVLEYNSIFSNHIISYTNIFLSLDLSSITNTGYYSNIKVDVKVPEYANIVDVEPLGFDLEVEKR